MFRKKQVKQDEEKEMKKDQEKEMPEKNAESLSENQEMTDTADESAAHEKTECDKIAVLEAQLGELNDKYLRLFSEFENFRKRTARE